MKKALSLLLAFSLIFSLLSVMSPVSGAAEKVTRSAGFQDVNPTDWFYEYVMIAAENGLVNGMTPTTFAPEEDITRAQFATILYRQLGSPSVEGLANPFKDLAEPWYKPAVIYMYSIGVVNGTSKDTFEPEQNITREQMVTMLWRMKRMADSDIVYFNATADYTDGKDVSDWARDAFNWAIVEGIINGVGNRRLDPQGNATRAQAAKVICLTFGLSRTGNEPVTLRFWQAGGDTVGASSVMRLLLDKFELMYPWITVDYQTIPWSHDPHTQFHVALAADDCADVMVMGSPLDFQLAGEGKLMPLDDLLSAEVLADLSDVLKSECQYLGSENPDMYGKMMSVPLYGSPRCYLYNTAIFDHFGVEYPTEGMSHADLLEMAKKLTGDMNGKQVYGYGTRATTSEQYLHFAWNHGAKLINPDTMTSGTDSEAWKKGIEDYMAFYNAGVCPEGSGYMDSTTLLNMFINGEIAMCMLPADFTYTIKAEWDRDESPFSSENLAVAPLIGETYATTYTGADVLAVNAATTNTEATALLVNYLMSAEAQATYCKVVGFFPSVMSAASDPYFSEDPILAGYAASMAGCHFFGNFGVSGVGTILKVNTQSLINGKITVEQWQKNVTAEINARIAEMQAG